MRLSFVAFTVATCHAWTQPAKLTARRASARMQAATLSEDAKVPVTILTGFLGSGKTTLLNHILTRKHGKKLAIIENEFGDVGIDDALLKENMKEYQDEEIIEMMNGCICCTVRQDLIVVLEKLQKRVMSGSLKLDGIVIETTGMADPAPVAQTFFVDETVQQFCRLDGIVTLVDAKHIEQHLDEEKPEGAENESVEQVAFADRLLVNKCDLVSEADLERVEARLKSINQFAPITRSTQAAVDVDQVLDIKAFDLERTLEMDDAFLDTDSEHEHDASVTSLCITEPGELDLDRLDTWISTLLQERGTDIFRMKGILAIAWAEQKYVYQGVHMIFAGDFSEPWAEDEPRVSKLVFIGKNLDEAELRASFKECLAPPDFRERKIASLRFAVGDKVECKMGPGEWTAGAVAKQLYFDEYNFRNIPAPYQVQLDDGTLIWAPEDDDTCIRALSA